MVLIKGKDGIFFTVMAILLISLFAISFTFLSVLKDRGPIQKRVESLNNFVFTVEEDLEKRVFIAGFRAVFLFQKEIIEKGSYVSNLDSALDEIFYNGTLNGEEQLIMVGAKYPDVVEELRKKAGKVNANFSLSNTDILMTQDDPWNVRVVFSGEMLLEDIGGLVYWNRSFNISGFVPIAYFGDPLYSVNTNSLVFNNLTRTPYGGFVSGGDVSNLSDHLDNSYYIASVSAPSFLDRLQGVDTANVNGIESLVDLSELSSAGISAKQKSVVDYIYFSNSNPQSCQISGMPGWFRLDTGHLVAYQVSGLEFNCA